VLRLLRDKIHIIFLLLFVFTLVPFIWRLFDTKVKSTASNELYNENLSRLNSSRKLIDFTDSLYRSTNGSSFDTASYVHILSSTIKERFLHGKLDYRVSENWIAWVCGKLFWSHFASIVSPEDILKHPQGLCSQQTIVFMHLLRMKKITVRSLGLGYKEGPGHFLCEVWYDGSWHMHDVNLEPEWSKIVNHHRSMAYYMEKKDSLYLVYQAKMPRETYNKLLEKTEFGEVNRMPARKMAFFHNLTHTLTFAFPPLFLFFYLRTRSQRKKEPEAMEQNFEEQRGVVLADLEAKKA
jgi:hypothetical protein